MDRAVASTSSHRPGFLAIAGSARTSLSTAFFPVFKFNHNMKQHPTPSRLQPHLLWLLLAALCLTALSGTLSARTGNNEQEATDRALLERRSELLPKLTSAERTLMAQFEARIEEGQRMIRSSQAYMQTQPSALNPNRDIAADRRRGQQMRERGEALIREGRQGVLEILRDLQKRIDEGTFVSPNAMTYNLTIPPVRLKDQLPSEIAQVMQQTRQAGVERIFFDTVFAWEGNSFAADYALASDLYELLLTEDSDRLVLGRAFDPVLQVAEGAAENSRPELTFDNRGPVPSAFIAAEIFQLADGARLLSFRTLDLDSWQQIASALVVLTDSADRGGAAASRAQLFDAEGIIRRFIDLPEPYRFAVLSDFESDSETLDFFKMRLLQSLLSSRTPLAFGESVFLRNYYLPSDSELEWTDEETAFFILQHLRDGDVELLARPRSSEQSVTIGTLAFPHLP
jgi:hypothetical protein